LLPPREFPNARFASISRSYADNLELEFGAGRYVPQPRHCLADSNLPAGELRLYGTGEYRFYASQGGGAYQSPAGDNGTLTFSGTAYTYTTPDGQTWTFNSSGQETSWASADGNQTLQFSYSQLG
jgi:hypothetical protein